MDAGPGGGDNLFAEGPPVKLGIVRPLFVFAFLAQAAEPEWVVLWPKRAPGSEGKTGDEAVRITPQGEHVVAGVHRPRIGPILPPKESATGAAVAIAPGGGHSELWADHEGLNVANWLAEHGVAGRTTGRISCRDCRSYVCR
jgi:hypothetical protein